MESQGASPPVALRRIRGDERGHRGPVGTVGLELRHAVDAGDDVAEGVDGVRT